MVLWILVMLQVLQHYSLTIQELCEGSCSNHVTSQGQIPKYMLTVFLTHIWMFTIWIVQ